MEFLKRYGLGLLVIALLLQPWLVVLLMGFNTEYVASSYFCAVFVEIAAVFFLMLPYLLGAKILDADKEKESSKTTKRSNRRKSK